MAKKASKVEHLRATLKVPAKTWTYEAASLKWFTDQVEKEGCVVEFDTDTVFLTVWDKRGVPHTLFPNELFTLYGDGQGEAWESIEFYGRFNVS